MLNAVKKLFHPEEEIQQVPEIAEWAQQCAMTPDNWKLEQYIRQLIFVPDDMKKGGINHDLIKDVINGPVYTEAYTQDPYTFWKKDMGDKSYPLILPKGFRPDAFTIVPVEDAPIQGELYFVPGKHIRVLDKHKRNGVQFWRDRVKIRIAYRAVSYDDWTHRFNVRRPLPVITHGFHTVDAWMYMGVQSYWEPQICGIFKSQMDLYQHDVHRVYIDKFYKFDTG